MAEGEVSPGEKGTRSSSPGSDGLKNKGEDTKGGGTNGFLRVFKYATRADWIMNAVAFVCMVAAGTLLPLMDLVFGKFVTVFTSFSTGQGSADDYRKEINKYTLWFVYFFIAKFVLSYIWTVLISITALRVTKALRLDFVRQTLRQEIAYFDSPTTTIASQVTTNATHVNQGISEKLGLIVQGVSTFVAAFIVAFAVQWKLTLIIIAIVPVNLIITIICVIIDTKIDFRVIGINAAGSSLAEEMFSSIRTVHAFWAKPKLSRKFEEVLDRASAVGLKKSPVYAVLFGLEFFCIYCGYGLAFWQGIRMYGRGEVKEVGNIITVVFAIIVAAQALTQIAPQFMAVTKAAAAGQDLFQVIDRQPEIDSLSEEGRRPDEISGAIELKGVHFSYPTRQNVPVFTGLDLSIPAKRTTALVGASGSGKSTIVGLIERWYSMDKGSITLDGVDIQDLNIRWLRNNIRLVEQEPALFTGSIFDNVARGLYGTDLGSVSDEEKEVLVRDACEAAFAHEFIQDLPDGYDTFIGERGATLSGGQKQRLVIARSIISNPRVLLLDEATSALDPKAEKIVQQALDNVAVDRTMVVIAHRLSTIRNADNIVVMSDGQVVEQGTHVGLIAADGAYARLVRAQDLGQEGAGSDGEADPKDGAEQALVRQVTTAASESADVQDVEAALPAEKAVGLFKCICIIAWEQRYMWRYVLVVAIGCVLGGLTYPAIAILFAEAAQAFEMLGRDMVDQGDFYALMFFVVGIGNLFVYGVLGWLTTVYGQTIVQYYRREIFDLTLRQKMTFFDDPANSTGALVSRLSSEPTNLQDLLSMNVGLILINLINLLSSCILAIVTGWKLGLVLAFGALPVLVFSGYLRIRLEFKMDDETSARFASSSGIASEATRAIRTVSSLALEKDVIRRYEDALSGIAKRSLGSIGYIMFWYSLSQSVSFLGMALGFWYGGRLISFGEYTTRQFYIVFISVLFSGEAAAMFFQYGSSISKAKISANYIFNLRKLVAADEAASEDSDKDVPDVAPEFKFDNVGFAYERRPMHQVLKGINTQIEAGKFVAFVGASGCGKTTMISLIERFYSPTHGRILLNDQDIQETDLRKYRSRIAIVQQEPVLYQGSIRENVALGIEDGEPSEEDLASACRQANIHEFVASLPEGMDTLCGSHGAQLSGGQRQRIAIARALVRQPRVLLLDEATSALDSQSEQVVKAALDRAAKGRTTIAVAHRLSTVMDAGTIVVFAHGRIAESGTHEELLGRRGLYYDMCLGQALDNSA